MKIIEIVATRCQILRLKCTKFDFGPQTPSCISGVILLGEGREGKRWEVPPALLIPRM